MFYHSKQSDGSFPSDTLISPVASPTSGARSATVIARGVNLEGEFHSQGDVIIEGEMQGTLTTGGVLTVGSEARIKANVTAEEANVSGTIEGNIQIKKQAVFHGSARVTGDITAERITVEAGAQLDGKVKVGPNGSVSTSSDGKKSLDSSAKQASIQDKESKENGA